MVMGTLAEPENIYEKWIELNEPKEEDLRKQRETNLKNNLKLV